MDTRILDHTAIVGHPHRSPRARPTAPTTWAAEPAPPSTQELAALLEHARKIHGPPSAAAAKVAHALRQGYRLDLLARARAAARSRSQPPVPTPPRRAQGRARRTPVRRVTPTAGGDDAGDDGPSDSPPVERPAVARVASVLVTDAPAMSDVLAAALSITPRQLRELVELHHIPHRRRHEGARHIYVRVDDVLAALDLAAPATTAPEPWTESEPVVRAAMEVTS